MSPLAWIAIVLAAAAPAPPEFVLASPTEAATILVPPSEPECVRLAAADLAGDVEKITGRKLRVVARLDNAAEQTVVLLSASQPESAQLMERLAPGLAVGLRGKWEAYRGACREAAAGRVRRVLLLCGSDPRGTMFALYAFCEQYLGVDPLYFWSDRPPKARTRLAWPEVRLEAGEPTFRYRGWFINDEDLLSEWFLDGGQRTIDYRYYAHVTGPAASQRIFEALLRLQCNLVIPASFVDLDNPAEARLIDDASRRGLWVSMHHVEPMGVSGFTFTKYWRAKGQDVPFSFFRHPDKFAEVWRHYAGLWARYPNVVWQLGLRGIADRPLWVSDPAAPKTDEARGKLISDAMALQWSIVKSVDPRPEPCATTTLWMEGADLHRKGCLHFPPGVAVIFADNSPGWQLQSDFYQVPREPGRKYGIYYHHALWGSGPHLVQAVSPQKTCAIFREAVQRGSTHYAILNVANVREFVLGLDGSARLLRDFASYDPERFLHQWCAARFGPAAGPAERCYRGLFSSFVADPEKGTRHLLDGELMHGGVTLLTRMLAAPTNPPGRLLKDPQAVAGQLVRLEQQRLALQQAGQGADAVCQQLSGAERAFFESNFVAQHAMLLGLVQWHAALSRAAVAWQDGKLTEATTQLKAAQAGIDQVLRGQELAARGPWKDWYRGDRKMDLDRAASLTREIAAHLGGK